VAAGASLSAVSASDGLSTASGERFARLGDIRLCCETFGDEGAPALLLVMGLASQMLLWDDRFCEQLASRGFWVIRYDNRDVGRSTILHEAGVPARWQLAVRHRAGAAYGLDAMADDAVGLLDHFEIDAAHVVGASMGGMIAQLIAIGHPERVRSLVSIMSTTGNRRVGRPNPRLALRMLRSGARTLEGYVEDHLQTYRLIGSSDFDFEEEHKRERAELLFRRGIHAAGSARQLAAVVTAGDRTEQLRRIRVPTAVIHGDRDPLVNVSGGRATAAAIPDAELVIVPGMGHDLPRELWPQIIDTIARTTARAAGSPSDTVRKRRDR
jgi:pimeloyl-ACP methyl ester carboxylesterase